MRTKEEIFQGMNRIDFLSLASMDLKFWCERVLGIIVKPFHEEWLDMFKNNDNVNIIAPTGHGKTLVMGIGISTWMMYNFRDKEILIVSNSLEQSTGTLDAITSAITENELLQELIPESHRERWSKTEIHTTTNCKTFCKPYSENIRSYHVDYILADEDGLYRNHEIFFKWVMTRKTAKKGKIVCISTPRSEIDLPHKLLKNSEFVSKIYTAFEGKDTEKPVFPELYTSERLKSIKDSIGSLAFDREYMCDTKTVEDALYPPSMVIDCWDERIGFQLSESKFAFIGCDFAISAGTTADYSVFVIIENLGRQTYVRRIEKLPRGTPIELQKDRLKELNNIYKPRSILLDVTSMGESFYQSLRQEALPVQACDFQPRNRNDYLINLRNMIEGKRDSKGNLLERKLVIPRKFDDTRCIKMTDELFNELTSFVITHSPSGMTTYKSTAAHDDIVMALALAVKGASSQKKFISAFYCE